MTSNEIIKARESLKMTRKEFASKIGVSIRTVFYWEEGTRNPSKTAVILIESLVI